MDFQTGFGCNREVLIELFFKQSSHQMIFLIYFSLILQSCNVDGLTNIIKAGSCKTAGASVSVGSNHGHVVSNIPVSDIEDAIQKSYVLDAGTAGHSHTYTIPASLMAQLKSGDDTVVISTDVDSTGHSHSVTIRCSN